MTYTAMPSTRTPAPGVMKFTFMVNHSLVIINIHVYSLGLIYAHEQKKRFHFYNMTYKAMP